MLHPPPNVLTPNQIVALCFGVWKANTDEPDVPGLGIPISVLRATYIALRESGGNAAAFRPASQNPDGGNDRGLWQINSKYWPNVSDATAFNAAASTAEVWKMSKGFQDWGPWKTDRDPSYGLGSTNPNLAAAYNSAAVAFLAASGNTVYRGRNGAQSGVTRAQLDTLYAEGHGLRGGSTVGDIAKVIAGNPVELTGGALASITPDWMESLGKLLGNLLDPTFWRRIGIGAAGILLVAAAFYVWRAGSLLSMTTGKAAAVAPTEGTL